MSAPAKAKENGEILALLRQAWREAENARLALDQAERYSTSTDLLPAFLMSARDHTERSKAAIERAAKLAMELRAEIERQL